jgi:hypothetical protein
MGKPSDTSTYIYRYGTAPNTRAVTSAKNKIYGYAYGKSAFQHIGACSEFGMDESRTIETVRGLGFGDQIAELVPGVTEPMTLTVNKTLLYAFNLFQAMGYKAGVEGLVRSLKHHRWPFDLKQELVISELVSDTKKGDLQGAAGARNASVQPQGGEGSGYMGSTVKALLTFFEGCWFNSYSTSYTADAALVMENSSVTVSDILDGVSVYGEYVDSGLAPIGANGAAGSGYSLRFAGGGGSPTAPTL